MGIKIGSNHGTAAIKAGGVCMHDISARGLPVTPLNTYRGGAGRNRRWRACGEASSWRRRGRLLHAPAH